MPSSLIASDGSLRLLRLHLQGSKPQLLSHSSMLIIHDLIYSSPVIELRLENLQLQDLSDWRLVIKAADYSLLETFALSRHHGCQPKSAKELWDFLVAQTVVTT